MNRGRVIKLLRSEKTWHVTSESSYVVKIVKQFGNRHPKIIVLNLTCSREGIYIKHPHYNFVNVTSHFSSVQEDMRLSLNKTILISLIRSLKKCKIWKHVINKEFLVVNEHNPKSSKNKISKELTFLLK